MKDKMYLYVMDYSDASIYEVIITKEEYNNVDTLDILYEYGFNDSTCNWMFTTNRIIEIQTIKNG